MLLSWLEEVGLRMGSVTPKQFLSLQNKPLLWHTVQAFASAFIDINIVLVLPETHLKFGASIAAMFTDVPIQVVTGGDSRFQSVKNGLSIVPTDAVVFVHDGVRCLITQALIVKCYEQAIEKGSAIPAVSATDSIRIANGDHSIVADRINVRIIQTPQTFKSDLLLAAFQQPYQEAFTDEATVVEAFGEKVYLIEGDYTNLKITRPIDLLIAEKILEERLPL